MPSLEIANTTTSQTTVNVFLFFLETNILTNGCVINQENLESITETNLGSWDANFLKPSIASTTRQISKKDTMEGFENRQALLYKRYKQETSNSFYVIKIIWKPNGTFFK
ncbi:hypothetical protein RF11_14790 [Thelohanellus kitauei]|uniref:Uncharacterized protein n=1 Tax=Thelohanellus kitauei TaxID=669202 RepID=A0A0C2N6I8_THEKT|nr:hypothetical protein RF11_14790 [Thelohanellus kitauei]